MNPRSFAPSLRALHWAMAAIIFLAIAIGVRVAYLPHDAPERGLWMMVHKSLGMAALVLVVPQVVDRLFVGAPAYAPPLSRPVSIASHAAHGLLYLLMIVMPVSGYVHSVAGGHEAPFFGLFAWPNLVGQDKALAGRTGDVHDALAWVIGAALALHLAAVVWHRFVKRDGVMARMWPSRTAA